MEDQLMEMKMLLRNIRLQLNGHNLSGSYQCFIFEELRLLFACMRAYRCGGEN